MAKIIVAAVFVALVGWDIWEGVGNLLGLPAYYQALGVAESTPWFLLVPGVVLPVGVLGAGLWWGWRRKSTVESALVYVLALAIQAALAVSLLAGEQAWRATVLLG